ncbi:DUF2171 domain-containing protein [Sphingomonadaceae bacterium jetA1]|jgi:hypothetical protein|uniref:DUF2171 domain-containing protein n=1 Tax=Facivitalis istanbulensis TaxID=3075838 RepID=UPI00347E4729
MAYDRYSRGANTGGRDVDYGRDYGSGRDHRYFGGRDYDSPGSFDEDRYQERNENRRGYGARDYGHSGYGDGTYGQRGRQNEGRYGEGRSGGYGPYRPNRGDYESYRDGDRDAYRSVYRGDRDYGRSARDDDRDTYRSGSSYGDSSRGYGYTGDRQARDYGRHQDQGRDHDRRPQGYDYEERGFFARAGDEIRSWFGDEDAERRRDADARYDERYYAAQDEDYHHWRTGQIAALDRDYDEYRNENRSKFHNEFNTWRTERQGQRGLLSKVTEHQEVVGSDGSHVGTVDKVRGDRILLTRNDKDAGGQHHSIPSRWLKSVEDKVTLAKTAAEAKAQWREEDDARAMFGDRTTGSSERYGQSGQGAHGGSDHDRTGTTAGQSIATTGTTVDKNRGY